MLTGVAVARRTVALLTDQVLPRPHAFAPAAPWRPLFDGTARSFNTGWARTSPDSSNGFALINGEIVTLGTGDFGLLYYSRQTFADFTIRVQFPLMDGAAHNSGIFIRFRDPMIDPTPEIGQRITAAGHDALFAKNRAWSAVHSGFEIQIDDGSALRKHRTGAI
jgi:hypothetical protein